MSKASVLDGDFKAVAHRQMLEELPSIALPPGAAAPSGSSPVLELCLCFYRHLKVASVFMQLLQFSYLFTTKGSLM